MYCGTYRDEIGWSAYEARVGIFMLNAVAMLMRREKTEEDLWAVRRVG